MQPPQQRPAVPADGDRDQQASGQREGPQPGGHSGDHGQRPAVNTTNRAVWPRRVTGPAAAAQRL
jgi:hypothetical protein